MRGLPFLAALCLLCACERPSSWNVYVPSEDAENGVYSFPLDFADSSAVYDLSFYARRDVTRLKDSELGQALMNVSWVNPDGECVFKEDVYLDLGWSRGVFQKYREGIRPAKCGEWLLRVSIADPGPGFRGLGIKYELNGTR